MKGRTFHTIRNGKYYSGEKSIALTVFTIKIELWVIKDICIHTEKCKIFVERINNWKMKKWRGDWRHRQISYMAPSTLFFRPGIKMHMTSE